MWNPFRSTLMQKMALGAALAIAPSFSVTAQAQSTPSNLQLLDKALDKAPDSNRVAVDDMMFPRANFLAYRNKVAQQGGRHLNSAFYNTTRWTGGNVYYSFDASLPAAQRTAFLDACAEWEKWVNVKFIARSSQANYINVYQDTGSYSYIGMVGGSQQMSLASWADKWTACHEIAHALGAMHEQCRSDRDNYVTINFSNVKSGAESNFAIISDSINNGAYDFDSVMHYYNAAFAVNSGQYTITCKPGYTQYQNTMGQRTYLSDLDKAGMVAIYGAPTSSYSLSGTVTAGSTKLAGTLMTLSGGQTVSTDNSGVFSFPSSASGTYTLTPSKSGYTFSPASRQIALSGNVSAADFTATAVATPTPTPTTAPTPTPTPTTAPTATPITISAPSVAMVESNAGAPYMSFNVSLSEPAKQTITVNFTTANGTATAGSDYVARSGTLTFKAGSILSEVRVTLIPDRTVEPNETFSVVLSNPVGGTLNVAKGTGTIVNDDKATSKDAPSPSASDASAPSG